MYIFQLSVHIAGGLFSIRCIQCLNLIYTGKEDINVDMKLHQITIYIYLMTCSTALSADVVCYSWPSGNSKTHFPQASGYRNQVLATSVPWTMDSLLTF